MSLYSRLVFRVSGLLPLYMEARDTRRDILGAGLGVACIGLCVSGLGYRKRLYMRGGPIDGARVGRELQ